MVTIKDPHIKRESGYHVHDEATSKGFYVKTESGSDYEGHCWPGTSSWIDFYNKDARDWYATLFKHERYGTLHVDRHE
jgi:mannosyl-oligosaccharide alpha-1,3-glucosidase